VLSPILVAVGALIVLPMTVLRILSSNQILFFSAYGTEKQLIYFASLT